MSTTEALHKRYYGEMKLPRMIGTVRHGYGTKRANWTFFFAFDWWSLQITFWHRCIGGFSVAYQKPSWVYGWAKYGVLTGFRIFGPRPSIPDGGMIPELCRYEKWSDIVTDKELTI